MTIFSFKYSDTFLVIRQQTTNNKHLNSRQQLMFIINTTKDSCIIQSLVIDEQVDDLAGSAQP